MPSIILCDDHKTYRAGLKHILQLFGQHWIAAEADHGRNLISMLEKGVRSDLILLDMQMPQGKNGYETAREISQRFPGNKVIILSGHCERSFVIPLLETGVMGQISKSSDPQVLNDAITMVAGGCYFFEDLAFDSAEDVKRAMVKKGQLARLLTSRELEVAKLMSSDKAYKQIAQDLTISPNTVENIRIRIFEKTGAKTRTGVALYMMKLGLI